MVESTAQQIEAERRKFEAWIVNDYYGNLDTHSEWDEARNCYTDYAEHLAWKAWLARAAEVADQGEARPAAPGWKPIETARKDGEPVLLYSEGFVDEDFNPSGCVEGFWHGDMGWLAAVWDGHRDCWDTRQVVPTHWQDLPAAPSPKGDQE